MKRNIRTVAIIAFFILFLLYGAFEGIKLFLGPSLVIYTPRSIDTVDIPTLTVSGHVARVAYITLNDRQIFADTSGNFTDKLLLSPGYNIIKVKVTDRFDKEVTKEMKIWYTKDK